MQLINSAQKVNAWGINKGKLTSGLLLHEPMPKAVNSLVQKVASKTQVFDSNLLYQYQKRETWSPCVGPS